MSERNSGFRFRAQNHGPPTIHSRPPKPDHEPVKQPNSPEQSATNTGARRYGFPSSMFRPGTNPAVITDGGWVRPSPKGWALPPDEPLGSALKNSNISATAIAGGGNKFGWGSAKAFPGKKKAADLQTIDSSEAAKKYGGSFML